MIRPFVEWSADTLVRKFVTILADRNVRVPYALALGVILWSGCACRGGVDRRFDLQHDSFSFANELRWEYEISDTGEVVTRKSESPPEFSLRCFPLVRMAREFFYHAEFRPDETRVTSDEYREMVAKIIHRNSRCPAEPGKRIVIPGFSNLRDFSAEHAGLLKRQCGGASRSFFQRGNWRMVFPVTKSGENRTAQHLLAELRDTRLPIVHVYRFPDTTLNHAILIYAAEENPSSIAFLAYDPNDPAHPATLIFNRETSAFLLERNRYFAGGTVKVYEVYRGIFF